MNELNIHFEFFHYLKGISFRHFAQAQMKHQNL